MDKDVDDLRPEASVLINENRERSGCRGEIVGVIRGYGPYQLLHWLIFCSVALSSSWHTLSIAFIAPYSQCWCISTDWSDRTAQQHSDGNVSMSPVWISDRCYAASNNSRILDCHAWNVKDGGGVKSCRSEGYDDVGFYAATIVTELGLFCEELYVPFAKSVYMIAAFISVLFSERIVNRIGRRNACFSGYALFVACSALTCVAPFFGIFLILRYFSALGLSALQWITFLAMVDSVGSEYRALYIACSHFGWIFGYMLLPAFAWFSSSWVFLQVIISVPCLMLIVPLSMLPESWNVFLLHGKSQEAEKVVRVAIRMNGMNCEDTKELIQELHLSMVKSKAKSASIYEYLKSRIQKKNLCFYSCSFMTSLLYYVLAWNSHHLHGNPYANFAMLGSMEVPSVFLVIFLGIFVQPKIILSVCIALTSVVLLVGVNMPHDMFLPSSVFLTAKTAITCAFLLIFIYGFESSNYPFAGKDRDTLFAAFSFLGAALSALFDDPIASGHGSIPITVACFISLICGVLALFLLPSNREQSKVQTDAV